MPRYEEISLKSIYNTDNYNSNHYMSTQLYFIPGVHKLQNTFPLAAGTVGLLAQIMAQTGAIYTVASEN